MPGGQPGLGLFHPGWCWAIRCWSPRYVPGPEPHTKLPESGWFSGSQALAQLRLGGQPFCLESPKDGPVSRLL